LLDQENQKRHRVQFLYQKPFHQSKSARRLCSWSSLKSPRRAHPPRCYTAQRCPRRRPSRLAAPSSSAAESGSTTTRTSWSERESQASQGLACVNARTESQSPQQSWHRLQISISKGISACILLYNSPVASRLQPTSHSRNARFGIVSFGHALLLFHTISTVLLQTVRCHRFTVSKAEIKGSCY